jgi:hypothetical protein
MSFNAVSFRRFLTISASKTPRIRAPARATCV